MALPLSYTTVRYLGLGTACTYACLGAFECLAPRRAALEFFGFEASKKDERRTDAVITTLAPLMGSRDLSIAAALFYFFHTREHRPMGVVVLSGMILCLHDVVSVWRWKGQALGAMLAAGATVWGVTGWALYNLD